MLSVKFIIRTTAQVILITEKKMRIAIKELQCTKKRKHLLYIATFAVEI